ncbi:MAG: ADP-ribosylglycohydrolase family protein [Eubacteriales bacterium]|nr:ADP-ribosylglycohydrolase family protein [Eubacteriales bacterium]
MVQYLPDDYLERVYAAWLGKIIGVRLGAPVEGWSPSEIQNMYGDRQGYLVDYQMFAADDDINGPVYILSALDRFGYGDNLTSEKIGKHWLDVIADHQGFLWWGGYGRSTEQTAYENLLHGIAAPRSGSSAQNGSDVAEQIGGQIFIDGWGMIAAGNPALAAEYARKAAAVSHDGNGIYGACFIAACVAAAAVAKSVEQIVEEGLGVIPNECDYACMVRDMQKFHAEHPAQWKDALQYLLDTYGYQHYQGACHIIPNSAVIVLALLYGQGDFDRTIIICNQCGYDTDCNVGNVGAIMGMFVGLTGINYDRWRTQINDLQVGSSAIGARNILDIPSLSLWTARHGYMIERGTIPNEFPSFDVALALQFGFDFPGATHGFTVSANTPERLEYTICHDDAMGHERMGALKIVTRRAFRGKEVYVDRRTYFRPKDFHDCRYDPWFSSQVYAGQTVSASVFLPESCSGCKVAIYAVAAETGKSYAQGWVELTENEWTTLRYVIPEEAGCVESIGVMLCPEKRMNTIWLDDVRVAGTPAYRLEFAKQGTDVWHVNRKIPGQLTVCKGMAKLEGEVLSLSGADRAMVLTGWDILQGGIQCVIHNSCSINGSYADFQRER